MKKEKITLNINIIMFILIILICSIYIFFAESKRFTSGVTEIGYSCTVYTVLGSESAEDTDKSKTGIGSNTYEEISMPLTKVSEGTTYYLSNWSGTNIPDYTRKEIDVDNNEAVIGFYMPLKNVSVNAVYTTNEWTDNIYSSLVSDAESSTTYSQINTNTFSDNTLSSYIKGDLIQVSKLMDTDDSTNIAGNVNIYNSFATDKSKKYNVIDNGSIVCTAQQGAYTQYWIKAENNDQIYDTCSIIDDDENKISTSDIGLITDYVLDGTNNTKYVVLTFIMPAKNITITPAYKDVDKETEVVSEDSNNNLGLSKTITSKGKLLFNNASNSEDKVIIDSDDIQKNRSALVGEIGDDSSTGLCGKMGDGRIYFYTDKDTGYLYLVYDADNNGEISDKEITAGTRLQ